MFEKISMLVPYRQDQENREQNWNWIKKRYELLMPEIEICIGDTDIYPYSKSVAVNSAARIATRDIFIIVDADIIINIENIISAIDMLNQCPFIIPYNKLFRLDKDSTQELLSENFTIDTSYIDTTNSEVKTKEEHMVGCIYITTREVFKSVGGFDERFIGWGGEDDAFLYAIKHLYGKYTRMNATIWHMNHTREHQKIEYTIKNRELLKKEYINKQNIKKSIEYLKKTNAFI